MKRIRDIPRLGSETWEKTVSETMRVREMQRYETANRLYSALARARDMLESVRRRGDELQRASEDLRSTNEEMRTSNEELEAANEELQSTTEELQATNEELEATTEELERNSGYIQALVDAMLDILFATDPSGIITQVNRTTQRISGYASEEMIGQPFRRFFTDPERAQAGVEQVLRQGEVSNFDLMMVAKGGKRVPMSYNAKALYDPDGHVTGVVGTGRNITEQEQAREVMENQANELSRSNEDLEQFAYVASHDLQEPLRMISSYVQLLAKRYKGKLDSDADEFIAYAVDGASRMQGLIIDLLAFSRVSSQGEDFESIDSEAPFKHAVANLAMTIEESGTTVTCGHLPTVMADIGQMIQVFQNLVSNAIKFRGEAPPRIHVSAEKTGKEWVFSVRDNGIGIDPEQSERIFVIFQRLHDKATYPGTGIGLAVCKRIVERHDGRIWVESEPGKGSVFCFTLPAREV